MEWATNEADGVQRVYQAWKEERSDSMVRPNNTGGKNQGVSSKGHDYQSI